jgi:hypothetical protein
MFRIFFACALLTVGTVAQAQTQTPSKPKSPGEIAAASREMAQKQAECSRQANEKKLHLRDRRKFIKACVKAAP